FRTGRGAAYETTLRDKEHGRIYRVSYKDARPRQPMRLDNASPQQLVAALKNDNMLWRMHAQRLLVEHGNEEVIDALVPLISDKSVDAIGINAAAIHALWTLRGLANRHVPTDRANVAKIAEAAEH